MSSEAYERERQNNALLDTLGSKVTELRDITINIYDNARDHDLIDSNTEHFTSLGSSLSNSASRLTRMAAAGNRVAVFKLAGIIIAVVVVLWWIKGFFF